MSMRDKKPPEVIDNGCAHDWQPIQGWMGRYRCQKCEAYGYRQTVLPKSTFMTDPFGDFAKHKRTGGIIPYKCQEPGCHQIATSFRKIDTRQRKACCNEHGGDNFNTTCKKSWSKGRIRPEVRPMTVNFSGSNSTKFTNYKKGL